MALSITEQSHLPAKLKKDLITPIIKIVSLWKSYSRAGRNKKNKKNFAKPIDKSIKV
jgi:hypothetical protein